MQKRLVGEEVSDGKEKEAHQMEGQGNPKAWQRAWPPLDQETKGDDGSSGGWEK
jgi:hypothetical protein